MGCSVEDTNEGVEGASISSTLTSPRGRAETEDTVWANTEESPIPLAAESAKILLEEFEEEPRLWVGPSVQSADKVCVISSPFICETDQFSPRSGSPWVFDCLT
jgi:hypothetical protein